MYHVRDVERKRKVSSQCVTIMTDTLYEIVCIKATLNAIWLCAHLHLHSYQEIISLDPLEHYVPSVTHLLIASIVLYRLGLGELVERVGMKGALLLGGDPSSRLCPLGTVPDKVRSRILIYSISMGFNLSLSTSTGRL